MLALLLAKKSRRSSSGRKKAKRKSRKKPVRRRKPKPLNVPELHPSQMAWENLPPEVRAEVHKRVADFHKGLESYRGLAQIGQALGTEEDVQDIEYEVIETKLLTDGEDE